MNGSDVALLRLGTAEPPPDRRALRAGPLAVVLEAGALRRVTWRGAEVLRGVAYLLRDRDWGTPAAVLGAPDIREEPGRFVVSFTGEVWLDGTAFRYEARIEGTEEGHLLFEVTGAADAPVETNRLGFVVLHPAALAGAPLEVRRVDSTIESTRFPDTIRPSQPLLDIRALVTRPAEGVRAACTMEAELPGDPDGRFEMEDQRNWSDASFKTYAGSLLDPWPYRLEGGRRYRQRVRLRVEEDGVLTAPIARRGTRTLRLGPPGRARLPEIGLGVPHGAAEMEAGAVALVASLRPAWLVVSAEADAAGQPEQLAAAAALAAACGARVGLEIVLPAAAVEEELAGTARLCAAAGLCAEAVLACPRALLRSYQPSDAWPDLPPSATLHAAARAAFPGARIGGGVVTYFTELNRRRPDPEGIDFVGHATAPIVHAADDASVMETLEALPHVARSVRALWPGLGHRIGPSFLAMRSNPYGGALAPNPDGRRVALAGTDPRQAGLFAAAWTVGYAAALAEEGVEMVALHASHGPSGLLAGAEVAWRDLIPEARVLPAYHALRALARAGGRPARPVEGAPPGLAALAWETRRGAAMALANLTDAPIEAVLPGRWRALCLDLPGFADAARDPDWLDGPAEATSAIRLGPYATAFLCQETA